MLSRRRLLVMAAGAFLISIIMLPGWEAPYRNLIGRLLLAGILVLLVFGLLAHWPARLPHWLARWAFQIVGVTIAVPMSVALAYFITTFGDDVIWFRQETRLIGFASMSILGMLFAPWVAMVALLREISGRAERQALEARLRLLQSQVEPHFLFNTLANVRELVDTGSSRASEVLGSLIAYLRAAVPQLHEPTATLRSELALTRAYLEVMQMRIPDRLRYTIDVPDTALDCACPTATLLTLVENAVRHGIDPSEEGGSINIRIAVRDGRCRVHVTDDGAGSEFASGGLGTGLANLRERLALAFGDGARLEVGRIEPRGTHALVEFPAQTAA